MITDQQKQAIKEIVMKAENETDAQIVVIFADKASHYRIVPLLYASLIAMPLAFILYYFSEMSVYHLLFIQLCVFFGLWLVISYEPIKFTLTPKSHKTARMTQRTRDLLWAYKNLNANPRPLLMIFIAESEHLASLKSDFLDQSLLEKALVTLTTRLRASPALAIEAVLKELQPEMMRLYPKTIATNSLPDAPFNL